MSERRHHTKLKRELLALMKRYDLDELAFKIIHIKFFTS